MQTLTRQPRVPLDTPTVVTALPVPKLDALTSLRFFAAAMIVYHHAAPRLSTCPHEAVDTLFLAQGVSFFFVLSGFILTYVYQGLHGAEKIGKFLLARFARLWPGHVVATLVALLVIPLNASLQDNFIQNIIANLLMVQTWTMGIGCWQSINPVSWSISTEFFFYICFIALIRPWRSGWIGKFAVAAAPLLMSLLIVQSGDSSLFGWKCPLPLNEKLLLYLGPTGRLLEFVLGMGIAAVWLKWRNAIVINRRLGTVLEVLAIALIVMGLTSLKSVVPAVCPGKAFEPVSFWLWRSGCAPFFGVLIFVMALRAGLISQILTAPLLVWLGEISYSIYLLHYPVAEYFAAHRQSLDVADSRFIFALYLLLVLLLSDLNYSLVENPFRQSVRSLSIRAGNAFTRSIDLFQRPILRSYCLGFELILATWLIYTMSCTKVSFSYNYIDVPNEIEFGNKVSLDRGVIGRAATGGAKMVLFWRSMVRQRLDYLEGVHVVGKDGKILALEDHPLRGQLAKVGECWSDTIYFPAYELEGANAIGVALVRHNSSDLLEIGRGPRDWGNHRLLIPLHQQAVALQE